MTYDPTRKRRSLRRRRETGCTVYIDGETLAHAGFTADEPPPLYRTWAGRNPNRSGGRVMVQLYREIR